MNTTTTQQAIRAERNQSPIIQKHALCLDCTEAEGARCHRLPARDIWDTVRHAYVRPDPAKS